MRGLLVSLLRWRSFGKLWCIYQFCNDSCPFPTFQFRNFKYRVFLNIIIFNLKFLLFVRKETFGRNRKKIQKELKILIIWSRPLFITSHFTRPHLISINIVYLKFNVKQITFELIQELLIMKLQLFYPSMNHEPCYCLFWLMTWICICELHLGNWWHILFSWVEIRRTDCFSKTSW